MVDPRLIGDWRFITYAHLMAALDSELCAELSQDEARHRRQLYYVLVLLITGRALNEAQGSGERESAAAWRAMQEQWRPRSRRWFTGMLLSILSYRFTGDAQAAIESFERCVREYGSQSTHVVPDFVKAGIVRDGIEGRFSLEAEPKSDNTKSQNIWHRIRDSRRCKLYSRHCTTANTHQRHQHVLSSENKLSSRRRSAGRQHLNVKCGMPQNTNETKRHHQIPFWVSRASVVSLFFSFFVVVVVAFFSCFSC